MNIFSEICSGKEYKDNYFFQEWHKAIIRDFENSVLFSAFSLFGS